MRGRRCARNPAASVPAPRFAMDKKAKTPKKPKSAKAKTGA